jgi:hypothetical protein
VLREILSLFKLGPAVNYFFKFWTYAEWLMIVFFFVGLTIYAYQQYASEAARDFFLTVAFFF